MAQLILDDQHIALESQVRECFGRSAYSHKTHERMADREAKWLWRVKRLQLLLSAATTCGVLAVLLVKDSTYYGYATAAVSFLSVALNTYMTDLNPGEAAQKHRETAADLWNIRESYLSLLTDIRQGVALDTLRQRRDELQEQLHAIYRIAPHTDGKAYVEAQDRLQNKEDLTFTDLEIDAMLPTTLRRKAGE